MSETVGCLKGRKDLSVAYLVSNLGYGLNMSTLQNSLYSKPEGYITSKLVGANFLYTLLFTHVINFFLVKHKSRYSVTACSFYMQQMCMVIYAVKLQKSKI